jgi:hypothetical protein
MTADAVAARLEAEPSVGDVGRERVDVTLETQEALLPPDQ